MQVEPHTDPHWPAQRTYARKQTGDERRPHQRVDAALEQRADTTLETTASSSPSHLFESSPVRAKGAGMGADRSCDTTVSSDDDVAEEDVMPRKHDARRSELLLSDDDDDDDGGGVKDTESDTAFLARFRRARAGAKGLPGGHSVSTLASSDLSDPPSLTDSSLPHQSRSTAIPDSSALDTSDVQSGPVSGQSSPSPRKSRAGLLPDSLQSSNSPTPSPYVTEAQKQQAERTRKESRETKVKALAKKARERSAKEAGGGAQGEEEDDGVDEVVESTSDIEEVADEDDLPSAIKAAQTASLARRQAEERNRAEKEAKKASRGKGKQAASSVLQMRAEDEESDSDLEHGVQQTDKARPLSRKEEEQMHRTQARVERELKANQARMLRNRGERQTYGLNDLLSSIDKHESTHPSGPRPPMQASLSNSSDPIESASEDESAVPVSTTFRAASPLHRNRRFTPALKEASPVESRESDEDEVLPDATDLRKWIADECTKREKQKALREKKARIVMHALDRQVESDEDEDIDLVESRIKMTPTANHRKVTMLGSPGGLDSERNSDNDDIVTDSQIRKAGRVLGAPAAAPRPRSSKHTKIKDPELTTEELNETMMRRARLQNIEMRRKKEEAFGRKKDVSKADTGETSKDSIGDMIRRMKEAHQSSAAHGSDHDESGSEFHPEGEGEQEEVVDLGSGDEDEESEKNAGNGTDSEVGDDDDENDSEKENSAPASQESDQPTVPRRPRITLEDDDEQEGEVKAAHKSSPSRSPLQPLVVDEEVEEEEAHESASPPSAFLGSSLDAGGFSQFFQATQVPSRPVNAEVQSSSPPRNTSATLGQFFEDTQPDQRLRGESFSVLGGIGDGCMPGGLSQFFNEGTQVPDTDRSRLMPPPSTSANGLSLLGGAEEDGFAALRKVQESEGALLDFDVDGLPSLEEGGGLNEGDVAALEWEVLQVEMEERQRREREQRDAANVTYINKDGFFTQTKPDVERYSFSQSQSQSQSERGQWKERDGLEPTIDVTPDKLIGKRGKRRFRRAVSVDAEEDDGLGGEEQGSARVATNDDDNDDDDDVESQKPVESRERRSAFDVMKSAMSAHQQDTATAGPSARRERNQFVQGEAEESDDEEEGPGRSHKAGRGGLGGVFSDDEAGSGSEDDDDGDDDGDLQSLIDEERDDQEAEKDVLARKRYFEDMEADDQAALALHEKATRGGMRSKRRAVNMDGTLEGFLDDDYEDEWLERKAKNPYGNVAKKRRLKGEDDLDRLEQREETQAFVRQYRAANERDDDLDKYGFLMPAEEDGAEGEAGAPIQEDEAVSGSESEAQTMTHEQLKRELEERRRRKKRQAVELSDDEAERVGEEREEAEAKAERAKEEREMMKRVQRSIYGHSSDDDDDDGEGHIVCDRLKRNVNSNAPPAVASHDGEGEDDDEHIFSALNRVASTRALSVREQQRLAQLQSEFANEPEWGSHDSHRAAASKRSASSTGGSVTSFGSGAVRAGTTAKGAATPLAPGSMGARRMRSKLSDVMSRQSQFSEESLE